MPVLNHYIHGSYLSIMVINYMITCPKYKYTKRKILEYIDTHDIKRWVIGHEIGREGYKHLQIRMASNDTFEELKILFPFAHIEKAQDGDKGWQYERKEGRYIANDDTDDKRETRFRPLRKAQKTIINAVRTQNNRQIDVWYDQKGNQGKSWLCNALYERGIAFYCPPYLISAERMIKFVCSGYNNEEMVVIDIPRSYKWTEADYIAIESIKDGLISDDRYESKVRNIRGVKVLVLCNAQPKLGKLSYDRWRIWETETLESMSIPDRVENKTVYRKRLTDDQRYNIAVFMRFLRNSPSYH